MAKLFITSATGYIGAVVAEVFKKNGYEVVALARSEESAEKVRKQGYKPLQGDIKKPETYRNAVNEADVVIHTAATNDADFPQVEAQVVETVVEALKGTNKAFVYTSGVWVLGNTGTNVANDEAPTNAIPLVAWRAGVEQKTVEAGRNGIRAIVIRPGIVYGRDGGIVRGFVESTKKDGEVRIPGDGENHWSGVHVEDLANLYLLAAEKANPGSLFNATHNAPVKVRTVAEHIAKAVNVPGKVKPLSVEESKKQFGAFADGLVLDQRIESPKAKRELGWAPNGVSLLDDIVATQKTTAGTTR